MFNNLKLNHQSGQLNHCQNENQLSHHLNFNNQSALHHFSSHLNPGHSNMPPHHPAFDNHRLINNDFNQKAKHFAEHKFKPNENSDEDENEEHDDEYDDENRSRSASRSRSRSRSNSYSPTRSNSSFDTKQLNNNSANNPKPLKSQPSSYQPSSKRQKTEPLSPKSSSSSLLSMSSHLPMPNPALGSMQQQFQQHQKQLNSFHSAYHSAHPLLNPQHQQQQNLLNAYAAALAADQQNQSKLMSSLSLMPQFMPVSSSSSSLSSPQLNGKAFTKPNPTNKSKKCDISNIESLIESRALNAESENCDEAKPKEKQFSTGLFHPDNSVTSSRSSIDVSSSSSSSCNNSPLKPASLQIESQLNMSQFELNNSKDVFGGAANPANMPPHLLWYLYALSAQSSSSASPADMERLAASMANQNMPFLSKSYNQIFSSPSPISPTEKSTSPNPNKASPRSSHRSQPYSKSKHSHTLGNGEQANDDVMDEHNQLKNEHRYDDESKQDEQNSSENNENEEINENGDDDSKQEQKSKLNISFSENSSSSIDNFESNDVNYDEGKANEDTSELKEKTESTNDERSNSPVMSPGSSSSSSYSIRKKQKTN